MALHFSCRIDKKTIFYANIQKVFFPPFIFSLGLGGMWGVGARRGIFSCLRFGKIPLFSSEIADLEAVGILLSPMCKKFAVLHPPIIDA